MKTINLLTISNVFLTFAWYGHLKFKNTVLWKAIRKESLKWNTIVGFLMILGAVFFIFNKW